jgi:outer membrane protein OmpA-like peptidoglycan-associated protein
MLRYYNLDRKIAIYNCMRLADDFDESNQLSQDETERLDQFFSLLVDLEIIEPSKPEPIIEEEPPIAVGLHLDQVQSFSQAPPLPPPPRLEILPAPTIDPQAFHQLQQLLVGAELDTLNKLVDIAGRKLSKLEHQIYEPTALSQLLIPRVGEVLIEKVANSKEEIIEAIAPIIDQIIEARTHQDRQKMGNAIASALSPAITQRVESDSEEMSDAISPLMGRAIKKQIAIEQESMVDALYPIIGSTVGKYMAEAIETINEKLEQTLSVEGVTRKIRAKMQGVSEAELILREAMPFKVQAIFLIHKTSGLLIAEVQSDDQRLESEMLAGMLTAIRGFVNDCVTQTGDLPLELDEIDYGTSKIVLEVAGYCYLAVVVKGDPPKSFNKMMQVTLGGLVRHYDQPLQHFEGDPDTVPAQVREALIELRDSSLPQPKDKGSKPSPLLLCGLALVGIITIPWGTWQYFSFRQYQAESEATAALYNQPELSVYNLTAKIKHGHLSLAGRVPNILLRQKAERAVRRVMPKWKIDNDVVAVNVPTDPVSTAAEVQRVTQVLNRLNGVAIATQYRQEKVVVEGRVSRPEDAKIVTQSFKQIPGVAAVNSTIKIQPLTIDVRFYFETASSDLTPADRGYKLQQVITFLNQQPQQSLKITGYSYSEAQEEGAQQVAIDRAKTLQQILVEQGIAPNRLQIAGSTNLPPGVDLTQPTWLARCVIVEPIDP